MSEKKFLDIRGFTQFINWVKTKFQNIEQELFAMELNSQEYATKDEVPKIISLTQAEYDNLTYKDPNIYYFIKES